MLLTCIHTISHRRNVIVHFVTRVVRRDAGARVRTIAKNSARPIALRNALREDVSVRSRGIAVTYSVPAAAQVQRKKTA